MSWNKFRACPLVSKCFYVCTQSFWQKDNLSDHFSQPTLDRHLSIHQFQFRDSAYLELLLLFLLLASVRQRDRRWDTIGQR